MAPSMGIWKITRYLAAVILLGMAGIAAYLWRYTSRETEPVLHPINQEYVNYSHIPQKAAGLHLEPFSFTGWDGTEIPAVIAVKAGEESSRQLTVSAELARHKAEELRGIDYVLVCVDWDHGIRSALPLAESLTAAGLTCVLWEPRGKNDVRTYCTHGLQESRDVPFLINTLRDRHPSEDPTIIAIGQGFGADMMLQAAAVEPRISGLVSIDAYTSLRHSVERLMPPTGLRLITLTLIDLRIKHEVGFESFNVAPVESATYISREVPVLVVNLEQDNPARMLEDALGIYSRLPVDCKEVWSLRNASDPPQAAQRIVAFSAGSKNQEEEIPVTLIDSREDAMPSIIRWMNDTMVPAIEAPHVPTPERPTLSPDSRF